MYVGNGNNSPLILHLSNRWRYVDRFTSRPLHPGEIFARTYEGCSESIQPFWISLELSAWPWCNLTASQRRPYCSSFNSHSPVGLVRRQWDAVEWDCILCDHRIQDDRASRSASSRQCAYLFYSCRAGSFLGGAGGKSSLHPGLSAPPQPRFGSLRLLDFPKTKIAVEREEIRECHSHTVHKLSQRRLTADRLAPRESDCSRMHS
jgi:hypothetical protein